MRLRQLATWAVIFVAPTVGALAPRAAAATELAAHRALYNLSLASSKDGDVSAATGKMAYEVIDACDGWAVRQRLDMVITNRDGQDINMVSDYTTWESKDGLRLRFRMKQTTDTAVTSEVAGDAKLDSVGGPGMVHYTVPSESTKALPPGTLFPMAHTAAIIAAAEQGKKALFIPLFDGTTADGAQDSSVAVVHWNGPTTSKWADLSKLASGRVHVAFFDRKASAQEPDYEVSMNYWENGVADELAMDFGDFVMNGKLAEYAPQKGGC
jgi:hypothetical protein